MVWSHRGPDYFKLSGTRPTYLAWGSCLWVADGPSARLVLHLLDYSNKELNSPFKAHKKSINKSPVKVILSIKLLDFNIAPSLQAILRDSE